MPESATTLATRLLAADADTLEKLRIHVFEDDESAHDDEFIERLYADFTADFERAQAELTQQYGQPARVGAEEDEQIPLNGVFRFAIWNAKNKRLFIAAAHEDREVPVLLMLGTAEEDKEG